MQSQSVVYEKIKPIQAGSFATVYLGKSSTGEEVALKCIPKNSTIRPTNLREMVRREVSYLMQVGQHPNICSLLDYYETLAEYVLVFEYCTNGDMYDFLKTHKDLSLDMKLVSCQVYNSLEHSTSRGIFHRDIKPENLLIDKDYNVKLTDWGLSTINPCSEELSIGTEKYLAPEAHDIIYYDCAKADYWSFGITLLFMKFGLCPFRSASMKDANYRDFLADPHNFLTKHYRCEPDHEVQSILLHLLCQDPQQRNLYKFIQSLMTGDDLFLLDIDKTDIESEMQYPMFDDFSDDGTFTDNSSLQSFPMLDKGAHELWDLVSGAYGVEQSKV